VIDAVAPVITGAPSDMFAEAGSAAGAIVLYANPTANDDADGPVPVTCTPASGSMFPFGATKVTCSAKDAHGNAASASFTITMRDTTPPTVSTSGNVIIEATSPSGAVARFAVSATDLVDGALTPTCTPASGSTFSVGMTTVTCSATDAHGNAASAALKVTVLNPSQITSNLISAAANVNFQQGSGLLQNALQSLGNGNITAACNQLSAFMNEVQAQSSKSLSIADATAFTNSAANARAALGCR
jgi:hypothetical protein